MSLFGAIGRTALKAIQSNNILVLRHSPQTQNHFSNRLMNMFGKISKELEGLVPERPKRPQSGYNTFYKDLAAKLKAENPDMKIREMAKAIGNEWKNLDPDIKKQIQQNSMKNSEEYKQEIEKWRKSLNDKQMQTYLLGIRSRKQVMAKRRLKSELKRLDYPIRPKSAFNLYVKEAIDNRGQTDEPFKETFKRVVSKWNTLSEEEREPYTQTAKNDKIRYLEELNEWQHKFKSGDYTKETLDKLTKLRTLSSRSYLTSDLKKEKPKKVVKKKSEAKTKKMKPKTTSKKTKAKPKLTSKSKKATKSKSKKTAKPKSSVKSKPKDPKEKTPKKVESSEKQVSSDSSDE